jgi:hypothetical protein
MGASRAIAQISCPHCATLISSDHSYTWCTKCGERLPDNIIASIQSHAANAPVKVSKPDWSQKPRSGLWKFTASMIWIITCLGGVALYIYSETSGFKTLQGGQQEQAIFEFVLNVQKYIIPGTLIVLITGVVYLCKRPGLDRTK